MKSISAPKTASPPPGRVAEPVTRRGILHWPRRRFRFRIPRANLQDVIDREAARPQFNVRCNGNRVNDLLSELPAGLAELVKPPAMRVGPHLASQSQRRRLLRVLDRRRRLVADPGFEGAQPLIDRNQFDDGAPGVGEILKRGSDLPECIEDLVHRAERDLASYDGRGKQYVGKNEVG